MHFICYMSFKIHPWLLLPSLGIRRRNLKKCSISTIYQSAEQNFSHVENTFKDTVDLRECPSRKFFTRAIQSATKLYNNEKYVKYAIQKKLSRFSSQQFETDDALSSELIKYQVWPLK